jgi:hypothetical protein
MRLQEFREYTLAMGLKGGAKTAPITTTTSFLKLLWCIPLAQQVIVVWQQSRIDFKILMIT